MLDIEKYDTPIEPVECYQLIDSDSFKNLGVGEFEKVVLK